MSNIMCACVCVIRKILSSNYKEWQDLLHFAKSITIVRACHCWKLFSTLFVLIDFRGRGAFSFRRKLFLNSCGEKNVGDLVKPVENTKIV